MCPTPCSSSPPQTVPPSRPNRHLAPLPVIGGLLTLLPVLLLPSSVQAQETGTITGVVTDAQTQRALNGAQLSVVGAGIGTLAGSDGRYTLTRVPPGEVTVRVQFLGFTTAEESVTVGAGETATVNFQLSTSALALDELIVTGVGQATQRRELSTSVSVIGADEIAAAPVQTLDQLLQGRVAGAQVNAVSAQPGTASQMSFRGVSSVFGSQTPVIYVDGVRVDNSMSTAAGTGGEQSSSLAELLVGDIERVEITRGGAASTLYGSDAATGVIQIFTRRGRPGEAQITARMEQGLDVPELKYILDAGFIYPDLVETGEISRSFVADEFFRNAHTQSYSVNVSGGSDDITYSVSGRIDQGDGIQPNNDHEVYSLRGRVEAELSERVRAQFTGGYTRSNFNRLYSGTAISDPITALEVGDVMFFAGLGRSPENLRTALDIFLMPEITESVNRFQFSTGVSFEHSEHLSARVNVGVDSRNNEQRQFQPIGFTPEDEEGSLNRRNRDFTSVTLDAAGTLAYPVDGNLTSRLTVGVQGFRDDLSVVNAFGRGFALPGSKDFGEAADITAFENREQVFTGGFFIDEQIGLWDRVFINAGLRVDGGTSFGDDVDFEVYPKAGAVWGLGREDFFRDALGSVVDELQLRVAYGETGKFPPPFLRDRTFDAISFRGESAPRFDNPGNPDLRPEVTQTLEAGFEAGFFDNRLGLDFTWFDARTQDALFFVPEQPATGQGTQIRNVGEIRNTGIELEANVLAMSRPGFIWDLGATFQTVDNEVTSMGGAADFFVVAQQRVSEGRPVGAWYVTTPIDTSEDGLADGSELQFSGGSPIPTRSGSFSTRFTLFDRLQLSALADWATGHEVFDYGSVWATFNGIFRREIVDCPPLDAPDDCTPSFQYPIRHDPDTGEPVAPYSQTAARSAFLMKGDWLKLREISARYALPPEVTARIGVSRGSVFGSVRNVAIWSDNPLIDPELGGLVSSGLNLGGESSVTISPPRSFRFGMELTF
jgi:TonB-dependent starch-binding outer membrane protein SusC